MAFDMNHWGISGNLTRDCEERVLNDGTSIINFSVAVNDCKRNKSTGEWEDDPNYFDCVFFAKSEAQRNMYVHGLVKGARVVADGKAKWRSWESKDGQRRSKVELTVSNLEIVKPPKAGKPPIAPPDDDLPF